MIKKRFILIAGICSIESEELAFETAQYLKNVMAKFPQIDFYFKASYDKANRTNLKSFRGVGIDKGRNILKKIKEKYNIKILTDVHTSEQAETFAPYVDVLQIPAFLCRQTDLVLDVGRWTRIWGGSVNIKKGQFIAPKDVKHIIEKIKSTGNNKIMITERGTCFGYRDLITDFRSFVELKKFGYPVIYDMTHSQQQMSAQNGQSGGHREFAIPLAKGAIATGYVDGIFLECHPSPEKAKSDSAVTLHIADVEPLLKKVMEIREVIR